MAGTGGRLAVAAGVALLAVGVAMAQPTKTPEELLQEAVKRQQAADRRAEATVAGAIRDADAAARTNPARAAQLLRTALYDLEQTAVSADARRDLTAQLQSRLNAVQGRPGAAPGVASTPVAGPGPVPGVSGRPGQPAPPAGSPRLDREAALAAYRDEVRAVQQGVELVARYQAAGRAREAEQVVRNLARDYPANPAVIALTQKDNFRAAVEEARAFNANMSDRLVAVQRGIARSAIPLGERDVEFPADWKEKTARRTAGPQFTAKERAIIESLAKPLNVSFGGTLQEALQDLSTQLDQPLAVDEKSLAELGIDLKKGVNLQGKNIPARTVLRQVLGSVGLTFVVKDEVIQVVTAEKAKTMLVTRVYYLGDVIQGVGPNAGVGLVWGPYADFQQTMANAQLIVNAIKQSVDPEAWEGPAGGPCSITFHYPSMSLIVRASTEVHGVLGQKLGSGR